MLNELKKICNELYVKLLVIIILVVSVVMTAFVVTSSFEESVSAESDVYLKGKEGIKLSKKRYEKTTGDLTADKLNETLKYYQSISNDTEAFNQSYTIYPGVFNLLLSAYAPTLDSESDLRLLNNADDFYNQNEIQIKKNISNGSEKYNSWEEPVVLRKAKSIHKPYKIAFHEQWKLLFPTIMVVSMAIGFSSVLISSRLFSFEKEKHMDLVLATIGGKKLRKVGRNKLSALLIFLSVEYILSMLIVAILYFPVTGVTGWSSQIQTQFFTSPYHLTFGESYLLALFMGWISTMAIGMLVSAFNAFSQNSLVSLLLGVIAVFVPVVMKNLDFSAKVKKFFLMQPVQGFFPENAFRSLHAYKIGPVYCLTSTVIIFYGLIILILGAAVIPEIFRIRVKSE